MLKGFYLMDIYLVNKENKCDITITLGVCLILMRISKNKK
jgi:hypothetical protein